MTSLAAPVRARTATRPAPARRGRSAAPEPRPTARDKALRAGRPATRTASNERERVGRIGAVLVLVTVTALVAAVLFHVVLAQRQMQLDRVNVQIAKEQRLYEQNRLMESMLSSPQRIIQEGERLGLVTPAEPATYLQVPGAPLASASAGEPSTTIDEYGKVKAELGNEQP